MTGPERGSRPSGRMGRSELSTERLVLGYGSDLLVEQEHVSRYRFAGQYVSGLRVLDVACGSGYGAQMLASSGATYVVGADLALGSLARAAAQGNPPKPQFIVVDAEWMSAIATSSFDAVVSFETIEHLLNPQEFVSGISRILRPGGRLVLSTPERRLASVLYPFRQRPENPFHVVEFDRWELQELLRQNFRIEGVFGQCVVPRVLVWWPVQIVVKVLGHLLERATGKKALLRAYRCPTGTAVQPIGREIPRFWILVCSNRRRP
jgi:SAM-dependent methyltransferase